MREKSIYSNSLEYFLVVLAHPGFVGWGPHRSLAVAGLGVPERASRAVVDWLTPCSCAHYVLTAILLLASALFLSTPFLDKLSAAPRISVIQKGGPYDPIGTEQTEALA